MLRTLMFSYFFVFLSCSAHAIKLVHFNIQEFDTVKIQDQKTSLAQVEAVKFILNTLQPDILSLNEIQYDLPDVPNKNYVSTGQNLQIISRDLLDNTLSNVIFFPANTGKNALANENNEYVRNPDATDLYRLSDPVNFGMFPAQYSTGALTNYRIVSITEINSIKWKEFNPNIDLSLYADEHQQALPEDMPLFDKNFTDALLLIDGHPVHLILLHTVPSYAFNNPKSANFDRNRDQLLFLKWYLGETIDQMPFNRNIAPLKKGGSFIAMGDWNADINQPSESADILKDLGAKYHYANDLMLPTFRGMDLLRDDLTLHLDYILLSNDIGVNESGIFAPTPNFTKLGCQGETELKNGFILVDIEEHGQTCRYLIEKNYYYSKTASDHLAVWADIYFK